MPGSGTGLMKCLLIHFVAASVTLLFATSTAANPFSTISKSSLKPGSCSRRCNSTDPDDTRRYPCSCSRGCSAYEDCCFDSPWRDEHLDKKRAKRTCVPVSSVGSVSVIDSCPLSWTNSFDFCSDGFGVLPPVTSNDTGVSYANHFCAVCNSDADNLISWDVDFKCCPNQPRLRAHSSSSKFVYDPDIDVLWNVFERDGFKFHCECKYFLRGNPNHFTSRFELRTCRKREISTCSRSWRNKEFRDLCAAYLDPVYIGQKVYRNVHCAVCSYVKVDDITCKPRIVEVLQKLGLPVADLQSYCEKHGLEDCLHFINRSRGRPSSFSRVFAIHSKGCISSSGQRCCDGEQYDYRHKRCRKLFIEK